MAEKKPKKVGRIKSKTKVKPKALEKKVKAKPLKKKRAKPLKKKVGKAKPVKKKKVATKADLKKIKSLEKKLSKKITSVSKHLKKLQNSLNKTKVKEMQDIKGMKAFINDKVSSISSFRKVIELSNARIADLKTKVLRLESQIALNKPTVTSSEEIAREIVSLYFREIARLGFKRSLDLDSIINAYYYTLERVKRKDIELKLVEREVGKTERKLAEIEKDIETMKTPVPVVSSSTPEMLPTNEPYNYTNSRGQKYFLHQRGKLFYFSKDPDNSIPLPSGFKVIESQKTGLPMIKKK